ncbi:protein adenylyltransferase SelO family protein [Corynebacterium cystitidis]|uniref:protein adenylyltransferase SelO family protein n=1 Tax=Corynebacterium cystitidis TaxID=35757 RepID=UPI00211EB1FF|nr:protein adenylyltransferase SelO family protein [Corynebacterium cystitidis]
MAYPHLDHSFADALPELAIACEAATPPSPALVVLNDDLARALELEPDWLRSDEGVMWLCGAAGGHATGYAGHQFGQFSGVLGDGRALLLGDRCGLEIQTKGSGRTPFSRGYSDGKGALGPMLREYLVSEFMHAAGVPTTRGLAVVTTGEPVRRDGGVEQGAIVVRVAHSHLRVGSFELAATQSDQLVERMIFFAGFTGANELLETVTRRQLDLVAQWMRIGFVHGVMNTDNTAISGETIDYGPCAFTEKFDLSAAYSSIDTQGRYAFGNQPDIIAWNLTRLANALGDQLDHEKAQDLFAGLPAMWEEAQHRHMPDIDALARADDITTYNREHHGGPVFIPRNQMLARALESAEAGDFGPYFLLLGAVTDPFNPEAGPEWLSRPEGPTNFTTFCGT